MGHRDETPEEFWAWMKRVHPEMIRSAKRYINSKKQLPSDHELSEEIRKARKAIEAQRLKEEGC